MCLSWFTQVSVRPVKHLAELGYEWESVHVVSLGFLSCFLRDLEDTGSREIGRFGDSKAVFCVQEPRGITGSCECS